MGPIDLQALRAERERRRGHHLLAHLRTEAYPLYRYPIYPAGRATAGPPCKESNDRAIEAGREAIQRLQNDSPCG